jgi:transcriptional antiterminator RfaH
MSVNNKKWFALYTKSRWEKRVNQELLTKGIETYLPLLKTLKQWSDRKKWVEEPLFRSYIFVNITPKEYYKTLQTNGVVRFITFRGERIPIPEQQIEAVKSYLYEDDKISPDETNYQPGDDVEVIRGPMRGLSGTLVEVKGKQRVLVEIESIGKHLLINIPKSILELKITP